MRVTWLSSNTNNESRGVVSTKLGLAFLAVIGTLS
jgi:hypothetical protein